MHALRRFLCQSKEDDHLGASFSILLISSNISRSASSPAGSIFSAGFKLFCKHISSRTTHKALWSDQSQHPQENLACTEDEINLKTLHMWLLLIAVVHGQNDVEKHLPSTLFRPSSFAPKRRYSTIWPSFDSDLFTLFAQMQAPGVDPHQFDGLFHQFSWSPASSACQGLIPSNLLYNVHLNFSLRVIWKVSIDYTGRDLFIQSRRSRRVSSHWFHWQSSLID